MEKWTIDLCLFYYKNSWTNEKYTLHHLSSFQAFTFLLDWFSNSAKNLWNTTKTLSFFFKRYIHSFLVESFINMIKLKFPLRDLCGIGPHTLSCINSSKAIGHLFSGGDIALVSVLYMQCLQVENSSYFKKFAINEFAMWCSLIISFW